MDDGTSQTFRGIRVQLLQDSARVYFEQVQGNANYYWERDDVLRKLESRMTVGFAAVSEIAEREQVSLCDAAYSIAIERVARACHERGWVRT